MLSAKLLNASHCMDFTIRRGNDEGLDLGCMLFRRMVLPYASYSHFSEGFRRVLSSSKRSLSIQSNIIAFARIKWFEFVNPMLFTFEQKWKQYQFQYFKHKSIFAVFVKSTLQSDAMVGVAPKLTRMLIPAVSKVDRASDIEFSCDDACNAVNARCVGDSLRSHISNCLPLAPCFLVARRARLLAFRVG